MAGPQFYTTNVIVASPTGAAETVVASLPGVTASLGNPTWTFRGWIDAAVAAAATGCTVKIRRGSISGTVVGTSTYTYKAAGDVARMEFTCVGTDSPGPINGATYVMTMTLPSGATASTVNALSLTAET